MRTFDVTARTKHYEFKPLLCLRLSRARATICRQFFELLDAKMSRAEPANQER